MLLLKVFISIYFKLLFHILQDYKKKKLDTSIKNNII